MAKKHKKVVIHVMRAADFGYTPEAVQNRKLWPQKRLVEHWVGCVEAIEVTECFDVAQVQTRAIMENELLRRFPDLELAHLYQKHFPQLAERYED